MAEETPPTDDSRVEINREDHLRLERISRDALALRGQVDALSQREQTLIEEVGQARGRDNLKPEVEGVLEELQKRAHERSVGAFERMLTGITNDVLPDYRGQRTVRLEMTTERSMPALDIYIDHMGDQEDVTSGAVANVLSTGLRFIALARSGARKFLVLDEADCWIEGSTVQNYFNVVNQLSRDAGIQTLVITHKDLSSFVEDFRIYRVTDVESQDRWPARRMDLVSPGNMTPTEFHDNPISFLAVKNIEGYPSDAIELAPGVTVIQGPNQRGKSTWARLLRAALMAESGDGLIRHGAPSAEIAIGFQDGRVLEYQRNRKGSPKSEFAMHSSESWAARREGYTLKHMRDREDIPRPLHHTVGAKLPEWMPGETGIHEIDGINVQLWPQFQPVFMLDKSPSARASLLSIGRESGYLFAMNEIHKDDVRADNTTIRNGEKEIGAIRNVLKEAEPLPALLERLDQLKQESEALTQNTKEISDLERMAMQIASLREQQALMERELAALSVLGDLPKLEPTERLEAWMSDYLRAKADAAITLDATLPEVPEVQSTLLCEQVLTSAEVAATAGRALSALPPLPELPEVEHTAEIQNLMDGLARAKKDAGISLVAELPEIPVVEATQEISGIIDQLNTNKHLAQASLPATPPPSPDVQATLEAEQILTALRASRGTSVALQKEEEQLLAQMAEIERQITAATEAIGNECPTCHSIVTVEMLLGKDGHHHDHDHDHAVASPPSISTKSIAPVMAVETVLTSQPAPQAAPRPTPRPSSLPSPEEIAASRGADVAVRPEPEPVTPAPAVRGFRRLGR